MSLATHPALYLTGHINCLQPAFKPEFNLNLDMYFNLHLDLNLDLHFNLNLNLHCTWSDEIF